MNRQFDIVIAGAGPAGSLTAILLARQGYRIGVLASPRARARVEGFSQRTVDILETHNLRHAHEAVGPLVERIASWAGEHGARNREYVTDRRRFDEALLKDLAGHRVDVLHPKRFSVDVADEGVGIDLHDSEGTGRIHARFFVEARGRAAPAGRDSSTTGPATTALVRRVGGVDQPPGTAVSGFGDGWAWFVADGSGPGYLQIFVDSRSGLPKRDALGGFFDTIAGDIPELPDWLRGGTLSGPVRSHNTAPVMARHLLTARSLRVGDAACALDPLSGNGVFAALGCALAAAPVISTLVDFPEDRTLAERFYEERTRTTFERFCRTGRDFYRMETRWPDHPFWRARQSWPDDAPSHAAPHSAPIRFETKPVVDNGRIVAREVCVTPDYPRGIWQVDQVPVCELVVLLKQYRGRPLHDTGPEIAAQLGNTDQQVKTALDWLRFRKILKTGDRIELQV